MSDVVLSVEKLSKRYRLGQMGATTLRETVERWWHRGRDPFPGRPCGGEQGAAVPSPVGGEIWALRDVSFQVRRGEVLGIIGRNGAGKSTLLKILSRITEPTSGRAVVRGRVGSLLEVGTGFHPELSGRENIYLNGAFLGMSRREIDAKFDEIVTFAEVGRFLDTPIKRYSSGMYVRLAFAVAAHLEPEILLVDEVLAVGDFAFQQKCLGKMDAVARAGRTVLFVSHNLSAVQGLCHTVLRLDKGRVHRYGSPQDVIDEYLASHESPVKPAGMREDRLGSGVIRITDVTMRDARGNSLSVVMNGEPVSFHLAYRRRAETPVPRATAGILVRTFLGQPIFLHYNRLNGYMFGPLPERGEFVCHMDALPLPEGTYRLDVSVRDEDGYLDGLHDALIFKVVAGRFFGDVEPPPASHGLCLVKARWSLI